MQTNYSLDFLLKNSGCYKNQEVLDLYPKDRETISYQDILDSNIATSAKGWFFCRIIFTLEQNKQLVILIAESILPIYEEQYPNCNEGRVCIKTAKDYLIGKATLEELKTKRDLIYDVAIINKRNNFAVICTIYYAVYTIIQDTIDNGNFAAYYSVDTIMYASIVKFKEVKLILQTFIENNK